MAKRKKKSFLRRLIGWLAVLVILSILAVLFYFVWYPMLKASVTTTYDTYQAATGTISNSLSFSGSVNVVNSEYLWTGSTSKREKRCLIRFPERLTVISPPEMK